MSKYGVNLSIQSEYGKIWNRKTPSWTLFTQCLVRLMNYEFVSGFKEKKIILMTFLSPNVTLYPKIERVLTSMSRMPLKLSNL